MFRYFSKPPPRRHLPTPSLYTGLSSICNSSVTPDPPLPVHPGCSPDPPPRLHAGHQNQAADRVSGRGGACRSAHPQAGWSQVMGVPLHWGDGPVSGQSECVAELDHVTHPISIPILHIHAGATSDSRPPAQRALVPHTDCMRPGLSSSGVRSSRGFWSMEPRPRR